MKEMILDNRGKPGHARGQRGRTAALLGGLVLVLTLPGTGLRAQVPDIFKSVLLSWPEPAQEQIVVGAGSLTGPVWTPWPEPIYKRFGQMCMAVPTTASQQFFKTVPGRQFVDDFSNAWGPFTNRNSWMDYWLKAGEEWFVTNGVLRVNVILSTNYGFLLLPIGTNAAATHRDFYTSVDILSWTTTSTNWCCFTITGRGYFRSPTYGSGYIGGLLMNDDTGMGVIRLFIYDGSEEVWGPTFDTGAIPPPYRLEFSGVGNPTCQLRLRVLNLTTKELIREQTLVRTTFTQGFPAFWISFPDGDGGFTITADNFFLSGTK